MHRETHNKGLVCRLCTHLKMVYTLSIFRELREKFPTWDTLQGFLTSVDGGLLHIIYGVGDNEGKAIIRYEKGASDMTRPHMPWFRFTNGRLAAFKG